MGWINVGDAPRKGDKPLEWLERRKDHHIYQLKVDKELWSEVKEYTAEKRIDVSTLIRYLLAKEVESK